ncbi:MAG: hypothetical protein BWY68_00861 [bacterium ADurb.Bin400]|nr:MAG: hypothetical protein BWY68_00861 [bacterium ADurb.Bin400]
MLQEQAARVMREFELSTRAATELVTANPGELEFYRYYDLTSVSPTKVRYFMNGGTFLVGKTKPVGVPPGVIYPPENEEVDFLIENVVNGSSIFNYYDDNNSELTSPFNISSVKMVRLTISLDRNPDALPNMITETTVINLRNMKRNL